MVARLVPLACLWRPQFAGSGDAVLRLSVPCEEIAHICIKRLKMFRLQFVDRGC